MLGLCETVRCRRQVLLDYFGEASPPCGNCDACLHPVPTWDATTAARKGLSAVLRTGQRFGVAYLTRLLRGKSDARLEQNGHHLLPTYGVGSDHDEMAWQSIFRQLVAGGYLSVDLAGHGGLRLTSSGVALLKGETQLELRRDLQRPAARSRPAVSTAPGLRGGTKAETILDAEGDLLFQKLRSLRFVLARQQSLPPYIIFHDSTLQVMADVRPATLEEMGRISGVGATKLERYGQLFLEAIRARPGDESPEHSEPDPDGALVAQGELSN